MKTFIDWQATTTGKAVNGYSNMRPCRGTYTLWLSNFIFPKFHPSEGFNFETRFIIYEWPARERIFHSTFHAIFFFFFSKIALRKKKKSRPRRTKHVHHRVHPVSDSLEMLPRDPTCCQPPQRNTLTVSVVTCFVSWHFHRGYAPQIGEPWAESNEQLVIGTGQLPVQRTSAGIPFQSCALPAR